MSINDSFCVKNWNKYCIFYNFLQAFNLTIIIIIVSRINIIKWAVNTTIGICKDIKSKMAAEYKQTIITELRR